MELKEYELAGIESIARGVCVKDGKVLLCRAKGCESSYLPGGHIEFGETGREALAREMMEEMGVKVMVGRFLGANENSFTQHGKPHAEINLVYEMTMENATDASKEDWIGFEWRRLDELEAANLLPAKFREIAAWPEVKFEC